jgi:hypothetical protein
MPEAMKYAHETPTTEVNRRWPSALAPQLPAEPMAPPTVLSIDEDWASGMLSAPLTMGAAR